MKFWFKNYTHFTHEDAMAILPLRNALSVRKYMYNPKMISEEEHLNWIKTLKNRKDVCYWGIYCDQQLIGSIDLTRIDTEKMFAEWGFFTDEHHLGLGAVIEFLGTEHFFYDLHLKTILAGVHEDNKKVYHMHKVKFGYVPAPEYDTESYGKFFYGLTLSDERWSSYRLKLKILLDKLYPIDRVTWDDAASLGA